MQSKTVEIKLSNNSPEWGMGEVESEKAKGETDTVKYMAKKIKLRREGAEYKGLTGLQFKLRLSVHGFRQHYKLGRDASLKLTPHSVCLQCLDRSHPSSHSNC